MNKFNKNHQNSQNDWKKDFTEFFGEAIPKIMILKKCGHIGSALTQFFVLREILNSKFSELEMAGLMTLTIVLGILFSIFIEKGFTATVSIFTRQIVYWKMHNKFFKIMALVFGIAALAFICYSPFISMNGGQLAGNNLLEDYEMQESGYDQKKSAEVSYLRAEQNEKLDLAEQNYQNQKNNVQRKYKAKINHWDRYYNQHKEKDAKGIRWAAGHMEKAINEKNKVIREREKVLDLLQQEYNRTKQNINDNYLQSREKARSKYDTLQLNFTTIQLSKHQNREQTKTIFAGIGKWFGLISVLTCLVCIIIIEIYNFAAGVQHKKYQPKNRWSKLSQKVSDKLDYYFWEKLLGIDLDGDGFIGNPNNSPTPAIAVNVSNPPHIADPGISSRDIAAAASIAAGIVMDKQDSVITNNAQNNAPHTTNTNQPPHTQEPHNIYQLTLGKKPTDHKKGDKVEYIMLDQVPKTLQDIRNGVGNYLNKLANDTVTEQTYKSNIEKWIRAYAIYFEKYPDTEKYQDAFHHLSGLIHKAESKREELKINAPDVPEKSNINAAINYTMLMWNKYLAND